MVVPKYILEVRNLTKVFVPEEGEPVRALNNVSLAIEPGESISLMGPNAAGKSTLIRCLLNSVIPDEGSIVWAGANGRSLPNGPTPSIPYVPQNPLTLAFPEMSLEEHLLLAERRGGRVRFWRHGINDDCRQRYASLLVRYGAESLVKRLDQPLCSLSGGWQQVFVILLVVAPVELGAVQNARRILLLDEPLSNLDSQNTNKCVDLISRLRDEKYAVIFATHDLDVALRVSHRLCILRNGSLVADLPIAKAKASGAAGIFELMHGSSVPRSAHTSPQGT